MKTENDRLIKDLKRFKDALDNGWIPKKIVKIRLYEGGKNDRRTKDQDSGC